MRTNYLDSLSDYRWQEERSELLSEIAEDCWTGRKEWHNHPHPNTTIKRGKYNIYFNVK